MYSLFVLALLLSLGSVSVYMVIDSYIASIGYIILLSALSYEFDRKLEDYLLYLFSSILYVQIVYILLNTDLYDLITILSVSATVAILLSRCVTTSELSGIVRRIIQ
jgi:hypothetical protein